MAAGAGQKIESTDYNNIYNIINPILGRSFGLGVKGYDGTPNSSQVAQYAKITASQWNSLRSDISRVRGHQTGTDYLNSPTVQAGSLTIPNQSASFSATLSGTTLTTSSVTGEILVGAVVTGVNVPATTTIVSQTSGTTRGAGVYVVSTTTGNIASLTAMVSTLYQRITETDRAAYNTMATACNTFIGTDSGFNPPSFIPSNRRTDVNVFTPSSRYRYTALWNTVINHTVTFSFPTEASATSPSVGAHSTMRAFFNTGGQILFSSIFAPTTTNPKNTSWQNILSAMGTIRFGYSAITASANTASSSNTIGAYGFSNLPATNTEIYSRTLIFSNTVPSDGNYYPNKFRILGRKEINSGSSGFDKLIFTIEYRDDAGADTPPTPYNPALGETPVDELVNGTLDSYVSFQYASNTSYIAVTPPTYAYAGTNWTAV
jgi:hypothetical protein